MFSDIVKVTENGFARLRNRAGEVIAGRRFSDEKTIVEVKGWVKLCLRERGKIVPGSHREGHNVWTNTGREYLALITSMESALTPYRSDSVAYIGVGKGAKTEEPNVLALADPVAYAGTEFLAELDVPPTFPLTPTRTTVRYKRIFTEDEITFALTRVNISEIGLFTNGSPTSTPPYTPGTRDRSLLNALDQAPVAYKSFEPVGKTNVLELEIAWEIRY